MVERWPEEPSVGGSNPSPTTLDPVDKLVKSSPFQGEDCEFEPRRGYQVPVYCGSGQKQKSTTWPHRLVGQGHCPFTAETGIRIPLGLL